MYIFKGYDTQLVESEWCLVLVVSCSLHSLRIGDLKFWVVSKICPTLSCVTMRV